MVAMHKLGLRLGLAGYLVIAFLPIAGLAVSAATSFLSPDEGVDWSPVSLTVRQLGLLLRTTLLAGCVSTAAVLIGTLAATLLLQWRRPAGWCRWLVLPLMVIPPFVHAEAWTRALALAATPQTGWIAAGLVEVMAYLPVATGLSLLGLTSVDPGLVEAARVQRPDQHELVRVTLPLAGPQILAGGCAVLVLSLADYSIPSLLQVNVYSLELFVLYSRGQSGSFATSLLYALPLLAVTVVALCLASRGLQAAAVKPLRGARTPGVGPVWPAWLSWLQRAALALVAVQILVPLVSMTLGTPSWQNLQASLVAARSELVTSFVIALAVGLACLPLALALAVRMSRPGPGKLLWGILTVVPLAVPAPLVGIGLVRVWNTPLLGAVYGTLAMPVLASLARFTSFAAMVMLAYYRRLDPMLFEAADLFQPNRVQAWLKVRLPLLLPGLVAAGCIAGALSLGELGATLIVAPPGKATATMRIYNYLHYGSSASVAGLCLTITTGTVLLGVLALRSFQLWSSLSQRREGRVS